MKTYSNLRVNFSPQSLVDFEDILHDIRHHYAIGYAGLFRVDRGLSLFLQRDVYSTDTRMALGKIKKICTKLADVVNVEEFEIPDGEHIESFGEFRSRGSPRVSEKNVESKNKTNTETHTESHNTSTADSYNTTNSHNTTNNTTIHLHINALGEEDTSRITKDFFEDFVGSRDSVVEYVKSKLYPSTLERIKKEEWGGFRSFLRGKVRLWDKQRAGGMCETYSIRPEDSEGECEDESDQEVLDRAPIYDPDSDSEGNLKRKRQCLEVRLVEIHIDWKFEGMLTSFEHKLSENPHNNNIKASTKDAYFKYFNGERWIKCRNCQFFDLVTTKRLEKLREVFDAQDGSCSEFVQSQVSGMIEKFTSKAFLEDTREIVSNGILGADEQRSHLAHVEKFLGRRIESVGRQTLKQDVVRDSTWGELEGMRQSG